MFQVRRNQKSSRLGGHGKLSQSLPEANLACRTRLGFLRTCYFAEDISGGCLSALGQCAWIRVWADKTNGCMARFCLILCYAACRPLTDIGIWKSCAEMAPRQTRQACDACCVCYINGGSTRIDADYNRLERPSAEFA